MRWTCGGSVTPDTYDGVASPSCESDRHYTMGHSSEVHVAPFLHRRFRLRLTLLTHDIWASPRPVVDR